MKFLLVFIFSIFSIAANSQTAGNINNFLKDANGRYVELKPSYGVEGSPFFLAKYWPARLTIGTNRYIIQAKLNLADNTVYFENEGKELVSSMPVDKMEFMSEESKGFTTIFKNGFPETGKNTFQTYYQVLDSGKATLLKHIFIRQRETRPYNSATLVTVYDKDKNYYLFANNKMTLIKKPEDLFEVLNDKNSEVKSFISSNKIKTNKESDLISLISFYNKL